MGIESLPVEQQVAFWIEQIQRYNHHSRLRSDMVEYSPLLSPEHKENFLRAERAQGAWLDAMLAEAKAALKASRA